VPDSQDAVKPQLVNISMDELHSKKFTSAGREQFVRAVTEYAEYLFEGSKAAAFKDRVQGLEAEPDNIHVRQASSDFVESFRQRVRPKWVPFCTVGEPLSVAGFGIGINFIETTWGLAMFASFLSCYLFFLAIRGTRE